jgi:hypothetical protein
VKQILRQHRGDGASGEGDAGGFDERRYGFGGLMDLLRACQKEGYVRIERDRRGGLRIFQGPALQRAGLPQVDVAGEEPAEIVEAIPVETQPGQAIETREPYETEQPGAEPAPIDTTAELLGRAKPKKARAARAARPAQPKASRKTTARRSTRSKKPPAAVADHTES